MKPPGFIEEVREHLQEMIDAGAIRDSESPYSSNMVIVRKKDGSIRFCVDFRKLKTALKRMLMLFPALRTLYIY